MTNRGKLPEIPADALRDHETDERVDRIWQRLEGDLSTARPRPRSALLWAPAALVIVFGAGVFVGARWFRPEVQVAMPVSAEPTAPSDEARPSGQAAAPGQAGDPADRRDVRDKRSPVAPPASGLVSEPEGPGLAPDQSVPPSAAFVPVGPPEWQRLEQQGEYALAREAVERQGGFDAVIGKAAPGQLMSLVNVARATGQRAVAIKALRTVVEQHPGDPNAPLAAWTWANILEKSGDRAGAAKAYAAYRALSPQGDFAEDALARQIDAAVRDGDVAQAKELAEQYAKDFPNGRRLGEIRKKVGKLAGEDAGAFAGDGGKPDDESPFEEPDEEQSSKSAAPSKPAPAGKPAPAKPGN